MIFTGALGLFGLLFAAWESYWRLQGATPSLRNDYGLWAMQRRRIDEGQGDATVVLGASRAYYDIQLPVWERLAGRPLIQLSYEATSPLPYLEDLAGDPNFTGRVVVGVEPEAFFTGVTNFGGGALYNARETPSQRIGQELSMRLIEPYFAFDDPDYALQTILARMPWAPRTGREWLSDLRKVAMYQPERNAYLWSKLETDPVYLENVSKQMIAAVYELSGKSAVRAPEISRYQIERAVKAVTQLRARGARVLFLYLPSGGAWMAYQRREFPRALTWDRLLAATGVPGIHFEDYPELQGYYLPDASHMTRGEAERFTRALYRIIARDCPDFQATPATARAALSSP